jgi:hypothetical protein
MLSLYTRKCYNPHWVELPSDLILKKCQARHQWLTPVVLTTQRSGRLRFEASLGK